MTDWLRMWHGAPTDPKWRTIARRSGSRPGDVWAVVAVLMDRASQSAERGSIEGYDCEIIADALGYEPEEVERIIVGLIEKGVVVEGRLASWDKYQPKREDPSAERVRRHRERDVTHGNAAQRSVTTEERRGDTEKTETQADACVESAPERALPPAAKSQRASRLAPDWRPNSETIALIREETLATPEAIERELVKAKDWSASAKNGAKTNHDAFFRNWCRNSAEEGRFGKLPHSNGTRHERPETAVAALDRHLASLDEPGGFGRNVFGERPTLLTAHVRGRG